MTTLITDGFGGELPHPHKYGDPIVTYLVYGSTGWTDVLERSTIDSLLEAGAIVLDRTVDGPGWVTTLYRSVEGTVPEAKEK